MNTPLKILLGLLSLAVLLFIIVVVAVVVIVKPETYRPIVVDAVESATGRSFELEGELGLKLLPCCSVTLGPSRLGNPDGFPDDHFARIDSGALSLKLWPLLLRQEVAVGTITLAGVDIDLVQLPDGRANWEFADAEAPEQQPDEAGVALAGISVEGFVLRDSRVRYRDLASGDDFTATIVEASTGAIATWEDPQSAADERLTVLTPALEIALEGAGIPGGRVDANLNAARFEFGLADATAVLVDALEAEVRVLDAVAQLTGDGRFGGEDGALGGTFTLQATALREWLAALSDEPFEPADDTVLARLDGEGRWSLTNDGLVVEALDIALDQSRLTGRLAVEDFERAALRAELALDQLDIDRYLPRDAAEQPAAAATAPDEPTIVPLELLADLDLQADLHIGTLRAADVGLDDLRFSLGSRDGTTSLTVGANALSGRFDLRGTGDLTGTDPALAGTLTLAGIEPRALLATLNEPLETADPNVLSRFAGSARWRLEPAALVLDGMRWQLDETQLTGSLRIDDFDRLATRFDLAVDRMNLDAYLPPEDADAAEAPDTDESLLPVELIRELNLNGRVRAGELTLLDLSLRDLLAEVRAADGVLRVDPLRAKLYGGAYTGTVVVDATGPQPRITLDQQLAAVQVGELLQSLFGTDLLAGSASLQLSGSGVGNTPTELLRELAGNLSFDLTDGVYRGMDVRYEIERARALLRRDAAPAEPASRETPIRALSLRGAMADGVLQTRQLSGETDALRLSGQGGIDLVELALDYRLDAQVLRAAGEGGGGNLAELMNTAIPITISGPLTAPKVGVDLKGLVTGTVRGALQQRASEVVLERLGGKEKDADAAQAQPEEPAKTPSPRDLLRRGLQDLIKPKPESE